MDASHSVSEPHNLHNVAPTPPPDAASSTGVYSDDFDGLLTSCSDQVWDTPNLRPMQGRILKLLIDPASPNAILAVFRTGHGKSHVIRMIGVLCRGVCLVFIPLLTLSADVMSKFQSACQLFGSVRAYHLDEIYDGDRQQYNAILQRCLSLPPDTDSTVFAFVSPQHLCKSSDACNTFLSCGARGTLRTVVMDEIHLHTAHGLSFREECRELRDIFFRPLYQTRDPGQFKPKLLCLTATMPASYYHGLEYLTCVSFTAHPSSIQRGSVADFVQTNIRMRQVVVSKGDFVKVGLTGLVEHLLADPVCKAVVFCNSRAKTLHYASELERKLNEAGDESDIIVITGQLDKHEKFWRIRFFCGNDGDYVSDAHFRVLVSTNAANVGIDNLFINMVIRFEIPRDLMTYFQERGRAARSEGSVATSVAYYNLESYANIIRQILSSPTDDDTSDVSVEQLQIQGVGSSITPLARSARRRMEAIQQPQSERISPYRLTPTMKRDLRIRQLAEFNDVMRYFFLNCGCQHYRAAFYMSSGILDSENVIDSCREVESCDSCPVCDGSWLSMHPPFFRGSFERFIESSTGRSLFPMVYDVKKPLTTVLSTRPYWIECLFNCSPKVVRVRHIEATFLSLIAAGIIRLERSRLGIFQWNLVWDDEDTPRYKRDDVWDGVSVLHDSTPKSLCNLDDSIGLAFYIAALLNVSSIFGNEFHYKQCRECSVG